MPGTGTGARVKVRFRCACRLYQGVVQVSARQFDVKIASALCPNCGRRLEQKKARFQLASPSEPLTVILVPVSKDRTVVPITSHVPKERVPPPSLPAPLPYDPNRNYCGTCQEEDIPLYPYKGKYRVCADCLRGHQAEDNAPRREEDED
jgi:hypothetical protein